MKNLLILILAMTIIVSVIAFGQTPTSGSSSMGSAKFQSSKSAIDAIPMIPNKISYQGLLTTSSGAPASDGSYDLKFELFNVSTGGSALWTETQGGVSVQHGTFNVLLGSVIPLTALFYQPLWVEITAVAGPGISSSVLFSPRTELASSPYSLGPLQHTSDAYYLTAPRFGLGGAPLGDYIGLDVFSPYHAVRTKMTSAAYSTGFWADKYDVSENNYLVLQTGGADRWSLGTMGNDDFSLYNWSAYRYDLYATMGGLVGIGTNTPTTKLDVNGGVKVKDSLSVGSSSQNGSFNLYQSGANQPIVRANHWSGMGAELTLNDEAGHPIVDMRPNGWGEGGGIQAYRDSNYNVGFEAWGDWYGLHEGYAGVYGTARSIIFEPRLSGDLSVQLPNDAISSLEILDEPGISNSQSSAFRSNSTSGSTVVADSVDITVPASGYIEVFGGAWLNISHITGSYTEVWLGINNIGNPQGVYPGLGVVRLPSALPTNSSYGYPCTARQVYSVAAGTYRYYLNLVFSGPVGASATAGEPWVRAVYYPTLYGTSTMISPTAALNMNSSTDGSQPSYIEQITITPEQHLNELKAKANALKDEIEATMKQLNQKDGSGRLNGGN